MAKQASRAEYQRKNRLRNKKKLAMKLAMKLAVKPDARMNDVSHWTLVNRCLDGSASEAEYCELDGCYCSYDGDFTYVGPNFGPLKITGPNAKVAYKRAVLI